MYSCEGEYNDAMSAQGQAEAEHQQEMMYFDFLNDLIDNKEYYLHSLYITIDKLMAENNKEFKPAIDHLISLKEIVETNKNKPLNLNNTFDINDLPF